MRSVWLILAGTSAFSGGLLHVIALVGGPVGIAAIGAPEWAVDSARNGTWIAPVGGLTIATSMWLCAIYAFSGAGLLRPVPLLRTGLLFIALVCLARGILLVPVLLFRHPELIARIGTFEIVASLRWTAIGGFFAIGLKAIRRSAALRM
jgi:hypothetical protein